jgi:hypothetical protein
MHNFIIHGNTCAGRIRAERLPTDGSRQRQVVLDTSSRLCVHTQLPFDDYSFLFGS